MCRLFILAVLIFYSLNIFAFGYQASEIRIGVLKHDVKAKFKPSDEKGVDLNFEYLLPTMPFNLSSPLMPRIHVGTTINTYKSANFFYTGLVWNLKFLSRWFVEFTFGATVHSGKTKEPAKYSKALGSRFLFRESLSLGMQINSKNSLALMVDHSSNGGLTMKNPGMTTVGIRYGLTLF